MIFRRDQCQPLPANDTPDAAYAALWAEAVRLLDRQEDDLDTLRSRAVALLAAGAVVAGLFAKVSMAEGWQYAGLGAFLGTALCTLFIVWPRTMSFAHDLQPWLTPLRYDGTQRYDELLVELTEGINRFREENQSTINRLYVCLSILCMALAAEVAAFELGALVS